MRMARQGVGISIFTTSTINVKHFNMTYYAYIQDGEILNYDRVPEMRHPHGDRAELSEEQMLDYQNGKSVKIENGKVVMYE